MVYCFDHDISEHWLPRDQTYMKALSGQLGEIGNERDVMKKVSMRSDNSQWTLSALNAHANNEISTLDHQPWAAPVQGYIWSKEFYCITKQMTWVHCCCVKQCKGMKEQIVHHSCLAAMRRESMHSTRRRFLLASHLRALISTFCLVHYAVDSIRNQTVHSSNYSHWRESNSAFFHCSTLIWHRWASRIGRRGSPSNVQRSKTRTKHTSMWRKIRT